MDGDGEYYDGAGFGKDPFQSLLKEHGNDNYIQNKWLLRDKILHLLDRKDNQSIIDEYSDTRSQDISSNYCSNSLQ